jgi:hypothetical protein
MIDESFYKTHMVKNVRANGGYARRLEDKYAVGLPDTMFIPKGYPVFIAEVKLIKGTIFRPTSRQYIELRRINDAGGEHVYGIMIGVMSGVFFFHENSGECVVRDCFSVTSGAPMSFHDQLIQFFNGRLKK